MLQSLAGTIRHKAYRKRVLTRDVRWSFDNGFEIAVALYAMLQTAVKGSHTYLKAQNNEPLRSEGAYICNDTGENSVAKTRLFLHELHSSSAVQAAYRCWKSYIHPRPAACSIEAVRDFGLPCCCLFDSTLVQSAPSVHGHRGFSST